MPQTLPAYVLENLGRGLALDVARATEYAAIAAARFVGLGDEKSADLAATNALRSTLAQSYMDGLIVVGASNDPQSGLFYLGEKVGMGKGVRIDMAITPLEGATICAVGAPNATACLAIAPEGGLLKVPNLYMDKLAVGPGVPDGILSIDHDPAENVKRLAEIRGVPVSALTVCVLDRPRNEKLVSRLREAGARISIILDGDVSGAIASALPESGVDIYLGSGGAAEGVLAAAGLRCLGGQFEGRFLVHNAEDASKAAMADIDPQHLYTLDDLVPGHAVFAATGVTDGSLLRGVRLSAEGAHTFTMVLRSITGSICYVDNRHTWSGLEADGLESLALSFCRS